MWEEFKKFAIGGNVLDLAVGVIIGAAFGKIVLSLVDDVIMPPPEWAPLTMAVVAAAKCGKLSPARAHSLQKRSRLGVPTYA